MVSDERMAEELEGTLNRTDFVDVGRAHKGKVRDSYVADGIRTIVTTDRQSAFDRILGTIPFKGQALNAIANFWFDETSDIVPNHLVDVPDPNVVRARECNLVALEFVVRAYITGVTKTSLWFNYEAGRREVAGIQLPLRSSNCCVYQSWAASSRVASGSSAAMSSSSSRGWRLS